MPMTEKQHSELQARNDLLTGNLSYADFVAATSGYTTDQRNALLSEGGPVGAQIGNSQEAGLTESQIYAKYNGGGYGPVGSTAARNAAMGDLAQYFKSTGMTAEQAAARAGRAFDANVGAGGAQDAAIAGAGDAWNWKEQRGARGLSPSDFLRYREGLEEEVSGQRGIFAADLRKRNPRGNPFQDYLQGQFAPTQAQYQLESAFAPNDPGSFSSYSEHGGGERGMSPDLWRAYTQSAAGLLETDRTALTDRQIPLRNMLEADRQSQYNLALQGNLQRMPGAFRNATRSIAADVWNDWNVNNPAGDEFLPWYVKRGQRF